MNDEQKRAFLAVVLSGFILFAWQILYAPPAIENRNFVQVKKDQKIPLGSSAREKTADGKESESSSPSSVDSQVEVKTVKVHLNEKYVYNFNNYLDLVDIFSSDSKYDFLSTVGTSPVFQLRILTPEGYSPVFFDILNSEIEQKSGSEFKAYNAKNDLTFSAKVGDDGKLSYRLSSSRQFKARLIINSEMKEAENNKIRDFLIYSKDVERIKVGAEEKSEVLMKWLGVDFNFHLFALTLENDQSVSYSTTANDKLIVDFNNKVNELSGNFVYSLKNYDQLLSLGEKLHLSVDFGVLGVIAVPILKGLQFFYSMIPNYGLAIIFLTILVRLLTFPLQYKSFQSMKKMQVIQPELAKLREKFKDDPQRMQKESMELFKRAGTNPLSGCLPLLLQLPIFFAFYRVLNSAVELVGSPFFGWIKDLGVKDPYFVLPVLMTITMFIQQKMTPTATTDPAQKKIMLFLPLVFGFIMKDLPAGLSLYIIVSTVCGILQQVFVLKKT